MTNSDYRLVLSKAQRQRHEAIIDSFLWRPMTEPVFEDMLSDRDLLPSADEPVLRSAALLELAAEDTSLRQTNRQPIVTSLYLQRYPELRLTDDEGGFPKDHPESCWARTQELMDLLKAEFVWQMQSDGSLTEQQFVDTLPDTWITPNRKLQLLEVLQSAPAEDATVVSQTELSPAIMQPGDVFGRYELVEPFKRGGMGQLWIARDRDLGRDVLMKTVRGTIDEEELRARFKEEAYITARLRHPYILAAFDFVEEDGKMWLVMPFIKDSQPLTKVIREYHKNEANQPGPTLQRLMNLFLNVCTAVAHAHSRQIIHRDLKPENILIGSDDECLVIDWGLAKDMQRRGPEKLPMGAASSSPDDTSLTQPGSIMGTIRFISPEQAHGRDDLVNQTSDIFSLGAILYSILTNTHVFSSLSSAQLVEFPCATQVPTTVPIPRPLAAICERAMGTNRKLDNPNPAPKAASAKAETVISKTHATTLIDSPSRETPHGYGERYASVDDLAEDIQRWQRQKCPVAYQDQETVRERCFRVIEKYPGRVSAAMLSLLFVILLVPILIGSIQQIRFEQDKAHWNTFVNGNARSARTQLDWVAEYTGNMQDLLDLSKSQSQRQQLRMAVARLLHRDTLDPLPSDVGLLEDALLRESDRDEVAILLRPFHVDANREQIVKEFTRLQNRSNSAQTKANAAAVLIALGEHEPWEHLRQTAKPDERSYLILRFRDVVDPQMLLDQLQTPKTQEADPSVRRAIILALGQFSRRELLQFGSAKIQGRAIQSLKELFANSKDGGVHSASWWTLTRWEEQAWVAEWEMQHQHAFAEVRTRANGDGWWINTKGHTMLTIPVGPPIFLGTPTTQTMAYPESDELPLIRAQVARSYAICATETTTGQFEEFVDQCGFIKASKTFRAMFDTYRGPNDQTRFQDRAQFQEPASFVLYINAIAYCNWLSEQDGIPRDQWCYPPDLIDKQKNNAGWAHNSFFQPDGYLQADLTKTGYRLPTEIEWENACRAGSTTLRHFGDDLALMSGYALHRGNSPDGVLAPVATHMPNDFGLFDMHGNIGEWCADLLSPRMDGKIRKDGVTAQPLVMPGMGPFEKNIQYSLRSGSHDDNDFVLRNSYRVIVPESDPAREHFGFRVARTLVPESPKSQ